VEAEFWLERWRQNQIGFHEGQPNALLVQHYGQLFDQSPGRVFLPLCGKTRDIAWLLSKGFEVCGVELSAAAIDQLFEELGATPAISEVDKLKRYSAEGIDIFVGDVFDLSAATLGAVDAVYDRAALVALPEDIRKRYSEHLPQITAFAPQLVICFEYDQSLMDGPPFSISEDMVTGLYGSGYTIENLAVRDVPGGLKGVCPATEAALILRRR